MRRSADLPSSSGEGDAEAEAWTGRRRAWGLQAEVEGKERRRGEGCGENERSICVGKVGREWREKAGLTEPCQARRRAGG